MIVENLPVPFDRRVWQEATTLVGSGCRVSVICPTSAAFPAREEEIDGVRIWRHPLPEEARGALGYVKEYSAALFWEMRLAWRLWRKDRFDVVHVANPPDLLFLVALPFKLLGARFVFDHHDLTPELIREKFGSRGLGYWAMRVTEWLSLKAANAVISTNNSYRAIALGRGGKRAEDVFVVRSSPDITRLTRFPPDPAIREKASVIFGYVGIMGSQDGLDVLLRILAALRARGIEDFHAVLIGRGPEFDALQALSATLGLGRHVTFTGYLSGEALHRALGSIDIGLCPDPYNEYTRRCTMNKIMEYMAFSKPLVQFDLDEGRFSAGEAALYARPGDIEHFVDQILVLMNDPALRAEMGARGRHRVEAELNWSVEAPKLLAAYQRALGVPLASLTEAQDGRAPHRARTVVAD
jgi:glycosyltransferase involved in cell wall biosynthesis